MGAQAVLTPTPLGVAPGGEVVAGITVTNTGRVVDSFALEVLGPAAAWARCEPETLSVFPGQSATAQVTFRPPAEDGGPAGPLTFGVHVRSHEDPQGSVVVEGILELAAHVVLTAELAPRTDRARGRRRSRHQLAVDNRGNTPATVELAGFDDQDAVDVTVSPAQVDIEAGEAAFVKVRVRSRHRFWKGAGRTKPFVVEARTPAADPVRLNGTLLNEAAVPDWLPKALALALVAAAALVAFWFGVLRPTVRDTAADAADQAAKAALSSAAAANGGNKSAAPTPPATPTPSPLTPSTPAPSKPALPGPTDLVQALTSGQNLTADSKHQLQVTDLVFQNPALDQGRYILTLNGQRLFVLPLSVLPAYDQHFVSPIVVPSGQSLTMTVTCQNPGNKPCTPIVLVTGSVVALRA